MVFEIMLCFLEGENVEESIEVLIEFFYCLVVLLG